MKTKKDFYKAIEKSLADEEFQLAIPDDFDYNSFEERNSPYFEKYGYEFSNVYARVYEHYNGIASEKYMPSPFWYWYVTPYLNRWPDSDFYTDKSNYDRVFPDVKKPETVIKRQFGYYWDCNNKQIERARAVAIIKDSICSDGLIVKPTSPKDTGCGRGVARIQTAEEVESVVDSFPCDFIIQRTLKCCPELAKYNPTSCNTVRVMTLRLGTSIINVGNFLRFGSQETYVDNISAGGGMIQVLQDGTICSKVGRLKKFDSQTVPESRFPAWNEILGASFELHSRIPTMDLCGWDFTVDASGEPVMIELNRLPGCMGLQALAGPIFGEDLTDEIMERMKFSQTLNRVSYRRVYQDGRSSVNVF